MTGFARFRPPSLSIPATCLCGLGRLGRNGVDGIRASRQVSRRNKKRLAGGGQWDQSEKVSTEDLRLGLRRYLSFFSRLLSL